MVQPLKSKWIKPQIHTETFLFGVPRGPSWAFKTPKSPLINRMSLKMGNIRLDLVITTKI